MKKFLYLMATVIFVFILIQVITLVNPGAKTHAHTVTTNFDYLIGSGPLCDLDPSACPAIAKAENDETVEITGEGTLSFRLKSVTGGGEIVHKKEDGTIIGTGTWKAIQLLNFTEFGCGGDDFPDNFCGGRALIRVELIPDGSFRRFAGILQVDCLIGDNIPEDAVEGIKLNVPIVTDFNEVVSGFTLFIEQ